MKVRVNANQFETSIRINPDSDSSNPKFLTGLLRIRINSKQKFGLDQAECIRIN